MSHPPMFGTFTVTVDGGSNDLCRGPDTLQRHDSRCALPSSADDMVTDFSDDNYHHLPAPCARLAFSPSTLDTSESIISPTYSNFSPSTSSGYSIPSPDSAAVNTPSDPDDAWNLIPYNVSWGHEYEEYRAGILPGPEGDCVFLRSPTPLRNQRASEACKKCRERKAKCTGTRPSCARCASRDYVCEYASEAISDSSSANTPTTSTAKARRPSRRETRGDPAIPAQHHNESSPPTPGQPNHNHCAVIKAEMPEFLSLHHYTDQSSYWEGSTPSDDCSMEEPWQFHSHEGLLPDSTNHQNALARRRASSIAGPHPVSGGRHRTTHPGSQPGMAAPATLPTHAGDVQAAAAAASAAAALHAQIQLPLLPHFDMPGQRLVEHEVYVQPEVKYEQSTAFGPGPHPYDSTSAIYHHQAGQDYAISMQPLQHGFDTSGFPMHVPAPKLAFNSFATPPYVDYIPGP